MAITASDGPEAPRATAAAPPPAPRRSMFWPTLWLVVALVGAKMAHIQPTEDLSLNEIWRYVFDLLIVTAEDAAFAAGYAVVGVGLLWSTRRRPVVQRATFGGLVALGVLSAFYAVASIHVFDYVRSPLTYAWLYLADDRANMASSIDRYATPRVIFQIVSVPVAYLGMTILGLWRQRRRGAARSGRAGRIAAAVLGLAVVPWNMFAAAQVAGAWGSRHDDRLLAKNPHCALVGSMASALLGEAFVTFDEQFSPECLDDFRPAGERPDRGAPTPGLARGPRNVILVVLESVGAQYLSLYSRRYATTPRLEQEAARAIVFDHAYAHITNTAISLVAMTLSVYPPELSFKEPTKETPRMAGTSVAEVLGGHGYRTAFISAGDNRFSRQDQFLPGRGFDVIWDHRDSGQELVNSWGVSDAALVDMVFRWLDADRSKPFFVMSWSQGNHHPFGVPWDEPKGQWFKAGDDPGDWWWDKGKYLDMLVEMDRQMGRLFDGLRDRGLADDTLVLIVGDHGEAFGDPRPNIQGHSYHVYQEDVHVPLMLWNPRLFRGPSRSGTVGGLIDLGPTILDLVDLPSPATWQGRSLLSPAHPGRAYFYGARDPYTLGVREGPFKYIFNVTRGTEELYDLAADPQEQHSVHAEQPELCRRLRQRLAGWFHHQQPARN